MSRNQSLEEAANAKESYEPVAKAILITMSVIAGLIIFCLLSCESKTYQVKGFFGTSEETKLQFHAGAIPNALMYSGLTIIAYMICAAISIYIISGFKYISAERGGSKFLEREDKMLLAAFWPITFCPAVGFYILLTLIKWLFGSSSTRA